MEINLLKDWRILILSSLAILSLLFILDYLLPVKNTIEIVTAPHSYFQHTSRSGGGREVFGIITNIEQIPCGSALYYIAQANDSITVAKTPIIGAICTIERQGKVYRDFYSIYNYYCLYPAILFLSSMIGIVLRIKQSDYFSHVFGLAIFLGIFLTVSIFTNRII